MMIKRAQRSGFIINVTSLAGLFGVLVHMKRKPFRYHPTRDGKIIGVLKRLRLPPEPSPGG